MGYKLEFTPPKLLGAKTLSMIYSGCTKPTKAIIQQASNKPYGIDVLVHEMVISLLDWAMKCMHTKDPGKISDRDLQYAEDVQNSSHTSQAAFGYLLTQIDPRPRLTMATHFQATDDTIASAQTTLDAFGIPRDGYTLALDFIVVNVTANKITPSRLDVSRHAYPMPGYYLSPNVKRPKYYKQGVDE